MNMDKRKKYYLTIDTETANGLDEPLVYDIGGCVHDKQGNILETFSFIIRDIFVGRKDLMLTSYYSIKVPKYEKELEEGSRIMVDYPYVKRYIYNLCKKYKISAIIAHNARFDYKSTTHTQRFLTDGRIKYFLPYGIPLWCTLNMARDTICQQKTYIRWCEKRGYITEKGQPRATAEILYRFIIGDEYFLEDHTGLEDVLIEKEIFARCMRQHKKMRKSAWE